MTWWAPGQVLGYAVAGGFSRYDAPLATAVAMLTSHGADHYVHVTPGTPALSLSGLFGVPDDQAAAAGLGDQLNPLTSAQTAHGLYETAGASWSWHPAWTADDGATVARVLDELQQALAWRRGMTHAYANGHQPGQTTALVQSRVAPLGMSLNG